VGCNQSGSLTRKFSMGMSKEATKSASLAIEASIEKEVKFLGSKVGFKT